jgi:hypothetical protein
MEDQPVVREKKKISVDDAWNQVPDAVPQSKTSVDAAWDQIPDGPSLTTPESKFKDVMPGGPSMSQGQDAITPPIDLKPASKWKINLDYSQSKDNVANTTGETIAAAGGRFDRSLAGMFNQLDFVQTSLGDALNQILVGRKAAAGIQEMRNKYGVHLDDVGGQPNINSIRPFKAISDAINFAAGDTELPNTVGGQVIGGIADIGPQLLANSLAPEISAGRILSKLGIDYFSKFGLVMGAQGLIKGAQDSQTSGSVQKLTTPIIKGIEQYATGTVYDMFGAMASKVGGRLAEKMIPEFSDAAKAGEKYAHGDIKLTPDQAVNKMLINSLGTTAFNAAVIGGYGNLVEFLESGDTSWKTFATGAGMGMAMGSREVGKLMMAKGMNSLISADPGIIERSINSPVSSEELISMAQDKFKSISDGTSKNPEGDAAAGLLATRAAVLKGVLEEVRTNPTELLKTIEESSMPTEAKTKITESLNQIIANTDQAVVEARPINDKIKAIDDQIEMIKNNSNLAPTDQEIKTQSLAAKREGYVNKVIAIHEKYAKIKTPAEEKAAEAKRIEDTKQANIIQSKAAVVFPQFNETGTKLAEDLGGRFESRLKSPESMVGKTTRTGNEVLTTEDVIGGAVILSDMKGFKEASKKLKDDGYTISNKRLPNKETGWRGVIATKMVDGIGTEIQLHTEDTWKAHQEALKLTNFYREGIPPEVGSDMIGSKVLTPKPAFPGGTIATTEPFMKKGEVIRVKNEAGEVIAGFPYHPVEVGGEEYTAGGSLFVKEEYRKKKIGENLLRQAMDNLPEGSKGLYFKEETIQNHKEVPYIFNKLGKDYDVTTKENGDVFIEPKRGYNVEDQIKAHNENGGSTFTQGGVNLFGAKGKASVSVFPDRIEIVDEVTPEVLNAFKEKNKDILTGAGDKLSIGTWKNGEGKTELDIVATPSRARAIELGTKYNQKAVFDLEKGEDIPTGGNGGGEEFKKIPIDERVEEATATPYEVDMAKSKALYNEAYKGLEDVNLEGSPAKTVAQRRMKELGIPMEQQKELNKAWTEMKDKIVGELKGKNTETKQAFKDFIKNMPPISDLSIKLQKRMLAKVNSIDFTKPASLQKAMDYFDKIVNNATWRYDELKSEQALDIFAKKSDPESLTKKGPNQPSKNIKGPTGLPLWDMLKNINNNALNKSWEEGQQKIKEIEARYTSEDRFPTLEEMDQITHYNFWGLLNSTNQGDVKYLQGAARDLMSIRKQGSSDAAAKKMFDVAQNAEIMRGRLDALNGRSLTPKELEKLLDTRFTENKKKTLFDKLNNATNWPITSSFGSRIEFLAQHDKTSDPYQGILYESLVKPLEFADLGNFIDTRDWRNEVNEKAAEIFGTKSKNQLHKNAMDRTKDVYEVKFKNVAGEEETLPITMNQAIKVYMELQDPTLAKSHEAGYYTRNGELTSLGQGVLDILTPQAKAWGDWQINEFYPKMYERLNPVYRMLYGRDMPYNSLYSPIFIQGADGRGPVSEDLLGNQGFVSGLKNGSLLDRVKHAKVLNLADCDRVLESYLHNMAYWKNYTEGIQNLNSFVKDPAIRNTIKQNFPNGEDHLKYLEQKVQIYLRKPSDAWMIANTFSKLRNNVLVSSLALKTLVGVNQVSSAPAFAEYMPMKEIPKYSIESLYHWLGDKGNVALAKKIWSDPYMQQRYQEGWDNVLTGIVGADIHSVGGKTDWKSNLMFPTKYGDFAAVLLGGIPVYRYHYDQAMEKFHDPNMAHISAMRVVREATGSTQQSGLEVDLAPIQEANALFKAITMYKSAPFQYQRKVAAAVRNLISGRGTIGQNLKTIAIYHVLLPSLFQFMSNGFKWDNKEEVRSAILGPYNDLLAFGDIAEGLWNIYNGESWKKYRATPVLSIYDDAEALVQHGMKVHPSMGRITKGLPDEYIPQIMKAAEGHRWNMLETGKALTYLSKIIGEASGLPIPGVTGIGKGVYDVATGKTEGKSVGYKMQRILGRSDYSLQDAVDDSDMTPEELEKLIPKKGITKPVEKEPVKSPKIPNF